MSSTSPSPSSTSKPLPEDSDPNKRPTLGDAIQTISPQDIFKVHEAPCTRDGLLTGIGSGAAIGVIRYIAGAPIPKAANWTVGSGVAISIAAYEYCQYKRRVEKGNMKRAVEIFTQQQAEKQAEKLEKEKKELELRQQQEALQKKAQRSWYKFW